MCGIAGFFDTYHKTKEVADKMLEEIKHRGPDARNTYQCERGVLGHVRLSIIDLSENGTQPMFNEDGTVALVFNGEIYNYLELREELKKAGHVFANNSDSEVLIHGYEEYGTGLVKRLRGMFAFVIYDTQKDLVFGARDHFGIKPFYYYSDNNLIFASEAKAILQHPDYELKLDPEPLPLYLRFGYIPDDRTLFAGIRKLNPGHFFVYQNGRMEIERYFKLDFTCTSSSKEEVKNIMKDSVEHHLLSDVKVGSFLSSGIDSSYLVALSKVEHTYTLGYNENKYSEIQYAKDLCKELGIENHEKIVTKEEYFASLDKAIYHMDEPLADPSAVSLFHVAKRASEDVKVVLSGEGADEFFGGYNTYNQDSWYDYVPYPIRFAVGKVASLLPAKRGINFLVRKGQKIEDGYIGVNSIYGHDEIAHFCKVKNSTTDKDIASRLLKGYEKLDDVTKRQIVDIQLWLEKDIFLKADRMTMAHSIEGRVPFSDYEVYNVARKLTKDQKVKDNQTKVTLRAASKDVIPTEAYNKKKLGFPVPVREWMKAEDVKAQVLEMFHTPIAYELFDVKYLDQLVEEHYNNVKDNYKKIWNVFVFLKWYQIYFVNSVSK